MMMFRKNDANSVFDDIQSDVYVALEEFGAREVDAWRDRISIPVQYVYGPHGGIEVIRSKRGEHPRKDKGILYDSIDSWMDVDATLLTLTIGTDVVYAPYLDDPESLDRPHNFDEDAFIERALDAIVAAI